MKRWFQSQNAVGQHTTFFVEDEEWQPRLGDPVPPTVRHGGKNDQVVTAIYDDEGNNSITMFYEHLSLMQAEKVIGDLLSATAEMAFRCGKEAGRREAMFAGP